MTNYANGVYFEGAVKALLESRGAFCVRSAGSRGAADIVAFWPDGPAWIVQARASGGMGPADRKKLGEIAHRYRLVPVKASRPKRGAILCERYCPASGVFVEIEP